MPTMTVEDNLLVGAIGGMPGGSRVQRDLRVRESAELLGLVPVLKDRA